MKEILDLFARYWCVMSSFCVMRTSGWLALGLCKFFSIFVEFLIFGFGLELYGMHAHIYDEHYSV